MVKLDHDQLVEAVNRCSVDVARSGHSECVVCGSVDFKLDYRDSSRTCRACGCVAEAFTVFVPDFTHYNTPHNLFKRTAAYRRRYHFNERVAQWICQGPHAPAFVVWSVFQQAKRRGIENPKRIDSRFIKEVCHSIGADKYAERQVLVKFSPR